MQTVVNAYLNINHLPLFAIELESCVNIYDTFTSLQYKDRPLWQCAPFTYLSECGQWLRQEVLGGVKEATRGGGGYTPNIQGQMR